MDAISIFQQPVPLSLSGFSGDPSGSDPNAYWDEAQGKWQCQVGFVYNDALGACVAVAGAPTGAAQLPIDPTAMAQQACKLAGLYWDPNTNQCLQSAPTPPVVVPGQVTRPGVPPPVPVPVPRLPAPVPAPAPAPPQAKQAAATTSLLTWLIVGSVAVIGIAALAKSRS